MSSLASGAGRARDGQTSPGQDIPAWSTVSQPIALLPHIFKLLSTGKRQLNRETNIPWSFASSALAFGSTHLQMVLSSVYKHSSVRTSHHKHSSGLHFEEALPEQRTHRTTSPWSNPLPLLCCPFAFAFTHVHIDVNTCAYLVLDVTSSVRVHVFPQPLLHQTLALAFVHILTNVSLLLI